LLLAIPPSRPSAAAAWDILIMGSNFTADAWVCQRLFSTHEPKLEN
jgi:hypothetical protein